MKQKRVGIVVLFFISVICLLGFVYKEYKERDLDIPVISYDMDTIELSIQDDESMLLEGMTAWDDTEGDLTNSIFIEGVEKVQDGENNEFIATYTVFDQSGNRDVAERTVIYTDYEPIKFSFTSELKFPVGEEVDIVSLTSAEDCIDGDITRYISFEMHDALLDSPSSGIYECQLEIINNLGDISTLSVNVEIYEDSYEKQVYEPILYLSDYILYLNVGDEFDGIGYVQYIDDVSMKTVIYEEMTEEELEYNEYYSSSIDWIYFEEISMESNVDTDVPGTYSITYVYTSEKTGYTGRANMIVVVE